MFTLCEMQEICMVRRGRPIEAIKDLIQERISGKHDFQYDISQKAPVHNWNIPAVGEKLDSDDELLVNLESTKNADGAQTISTPSETEGQAFNYTPSKSSSRDSLYDYFIGLRIDSESMHGVGPSTQTDIFGQLV